MRYIGCKTKLLENIDSAIEKFCPEASTVCDIFSGTAAVARHLKSKYEVISNDILYFSYVLQMATVENDCVPEFRLLKNEGIDNPLLFFNNMETKQMESLPEDKRLFQSYYSPKGDRQYFTEENALRIDFARNTLEDWSDAGLLEDFEYFYLLACIVEGVPFVSNTAGTYGAFNKFWDKRAFKTFELFDLPVTTNGKNNRCYNEDGLQLLKRISGDVLYVDPPYNGRQYLPNYHVLETAAKYDWPEVRGITGQRPYEDNKSDFCLKRKVLPAFEQLVENANFKHIILSYNTEGLMSVDDIESAMERHGIPESFEIIEIPYRRFKSRATRHTGEIKELLIHIEKDVTQ